MSVLEVLERSMKTPGTTKRSNRFALPKGFNISFRKTKPKVGGQHNWFLSFRIEQSADGKIGGRSISFDRTNYHEKYEEAIAAFHEVRPNTVLTFKPPTFNQILKDLEISERTQSIYYYKPIADE